MKTIIVCAYRFDTVCFGCNKTIPVYFAVPYSAEPPILRRCRDCGALYLFSSEEERYGFLEKLLKNKACVKCDADLATTLVPAYKHIKCDCGEEFSLDDDFSRSFKYDDAALEQVSVSPLCW